MEKLTAGEMAEKWGLSLRRVQDLCRMGKIHEAERFGKNWMIPADAPRPVDGRSKAAKSAAAEWIPMPRRSPMLTMTDLYQTPGSAAKAAKALAGNPEAALLFEAQIAYAQGQIDKACADARQVLEHHRGFYAVAGAGLLLSICAIWKGDEALWYEMKNHLARLRCHSNTERDILSLVFAAANSSVYDQTTYPEWFERGSFEHLPVDVHAMTKVFYAKLLYMAGFGVASKQYSLEGVQGLALMRMVPNTLEPLICQAVVDKTVIPEIYLRLYCAVAYHNVGRKDLAVYHIDRAIALALPDRLYGILAEHWRILDALMEERLTLADPEAMKAIKELYRRFLVGQASLGGSIRNRVIATNLTVREREVAKLAAFGFTNKKIALALQIGESTVKTTVQNIMQKTGLSARTDFYYIL